MGAPERGRGTSSELGRSATDDDFRTDHERRVLAREEYCRFGNFDGIAQLFLTANRTREFFFATVRPKRQQPPLDSNCTEILADLTKAESGPPASGL